MAAGIHWSSEKLIRMVSNSLTAETFSDSTPISVKTRGQLIKVKEYSWNWIPSPANVTHPTDDSGIYLTILMKVPDSRFDSVEVGIVTSPLLYRDL